MSRAETVLLRVEGMPEGGPGRVLFTWPPTGERLVWDPGTDLAYRVLVERGGGVHHRAEPVPGARPSAVDLAGRRNR